MIAPRSPRTRNTPAASACDGNGLSSTKKERPGPAETASGKVPLTSTSRAKDLVGATALIVAAPENLEIRAWRWPVSSTAPTVGASTETPAIPPSIGGMNVGTQSPRNGRRYAPDKRDGTPSRSTAANHAKCGPGPAASIVVTNRVP